MTHAGSHINGLCSQLFSFRHIKMAFKLRGMQTIKSEKGKLGLPKHEQQKMSRAKRQEEWDAFMKTKPDDNYMNPDDVAAIKEAERNMGDFKLKSDKDFLPSEDQRMTAHRKKQQVCTRVCHAVTRLHGNIHIYCQNAWFIIGAGTAGCQAMLCAHCAELA
jgi:hypothetical protein